MRLIPSEIRAAADYVTGTVKSGVNGAVEEVTALVDLIGRATALMDDAERLVIRANAALAGAEAQLAGSEALLARSDALLARGEAMLVRGESLVAGGEAMLVRGESLVQRGETMLDETDAMVAPLRPLAEAATPVLARVLPMATTVVNSIEPDEVDAVVRTVNHLPALVDTVETQVIPNLARLERIGPDVHEILENVSDLSKAMMGMPGMGWMQRRGAEKQEEEDEHEHPSV